MALLFAACSKGEYYDKDIVGGRISYYNGNGRGYMMYIADNLVTDVLDELVMALGVNQMGTQTSSHFVMDGSLVEVGSTWSVKAGDNVFKGMTIRCYAADSWSISFDGDYAFGTNYYPTRFTMKAVRMDSGKDSALPAGAEGWRVTLLGERDERGGYMCTFSTGATAGLPHLDYMNTRGTGASGWNWMAGDLSMSVYKDGDVVDVCCLSFEGSPSQATFVRGL